MSSNPMMCERGRRRFLSPPQRRPSTYHRIILWILVIVFAILNVWIRVASAQGRYVDPMWGYDARPGPRYFEPYSYSYGPNIYFGPPVQNYVPSYRPYNYHYGYGVQQWRGSNYPEYTGRGWIAPWGWGGNWGRPYRQY